MQRSNRLDSYRAHLDSLFNFSFAEPRPKTSKREDSTRILLTPDEKRAMGMWMTTVLELHSEEFEHALKHCRIFSIGEMEAYLIKHYTHLKSIIRFYIIAALLDYDRVCNIQDSPQEVQRPCIFINILIEQLTSRFFRESQWLHKISHLPVYSIFPVFDKFQKGYTTLKEIRQTLESHFTDLKKLNKLKSAAKKQKKLVFLVQKKLACNLDGHDLNICQQNFEEIMLRVNLITFQETFGSKQKISSSSRYLFINGEIMKFKGIQTERTRREMYGELERSRKDEEELDLLREDYQIKQNSQAMSRREYKSQIDKPEWQSTAYKEKFLSTPYSTQLSRPNQRYESASKHEKDTQFYSKKDLKYPKTDQKLIYSTTSRKQNNFNIQNRIQGQILFKTMVDTQKNRSKLGLRMLIMSQLKIIREQKKKNHLLLLQYI